MSFKSKFQEQSSNFRKKNTSGFDYYLDLKKFNLERFKFEKEQKDYLLDILPYKIETDKHPDYNKREKSFFFEVFVHNYIGVNKGNYLCMKKMYGQECEICNEFVHLKEKYESEGLSNKEIWDNIKDLAYKQRILYYVLYKEKVYVLDMPYKSFQQTWELSIERKKQRGEDIFPIYLNEEGCTSLEFTYIPKGQNFYDLINFEFPKIEKYNPKHLEGLVSFEKLLIIPDQNKIKDSLLGVYEEDEEYSEEAESKKDYYEDVVVKEEKQQGLETKVETEEPVRKKKKVALDVCPYEEQFGTKFGTIDHDGYVHCDSCFDDHNEVFEACKKAYNEGK